MSGIHEECGVFGIYCRDGMNVVSAAYYALYALQHRGQESCGIAVNDDGVIRCVKNPGLVNEVITREAVETLGEGRMAVGHVRYGTSGADPRQNAQPLVVNHIKGYMALAHNGALTNARELREELELRGSIFHMTSDSEVISYVITRERLSSKSIEEAVSRSMDVLKGAYSMVVMSPRKLIAARDPFGFRPLCMGRIGENVVFASESCALDAIGATFERDIEPGEIVVVDEDGVRTDRTHVGVQPKRTCVFEYIYFARPDSVIDGSSVHTARVRAGSFLALEHPVQADVVIGVPDSGIDAAIGFSRQSGIPYGIGFIKNKYIGRTFIARTRCASSSTSSPRWCAASAWCWWTIPSCAVRPRRASSRCCARRGRPRCTCARPRRRLRIPATSAPTSTAATGSSPAGIRWIRSRTSSAWTRSAF